MKSGDITIGRKLSPEDCEFGLSIDDREDTSPRGVRRPGMPEEGGRFQGLRGVRARRGLVAALGREERSWRHCRVGSGSRFVEAASACVGRPSERSPFPQVATIFNYSNSSL